MSLLIEEHFCVPPDDATAWKPIGQSSVVFGETPALYVCPECGQRLVRVEQSATVAFSRCQAHERRQLLAVDHA